jgi:hypothetical protein
LNATPARQQQLPSSTNEYGDISHINSDYVDIVGDQNNVYNIGNIAL